ncbi:hypothetical protein A3A71_04200 [Candidatus Berkelbacteria bacterium RIFCSPLOWO2_01_FULL_50_28]|uniref:Helix-turn-helix domain-containing protein n=1 Tax=Candidatus Berkelbacteria bacterium RIFCSPLOWO2_01_FULL_50_28 TaxID=1797471 RepID=A0A1F5EAQ5_9BACT|nr:MAG: hypothetical protein A2807_03410 [Candidatus Berkelbacteria bacterium RIFCSPHIGHO2_01_FULL_50_36]OGD62447.1 MAG: hypothetical protein A3F39_01950 [Candidatus Berkelbacteria bacterium RIFCSPHIGHO2_12_FULL_50_11]OGD64334.1 MAG: hypothetical protein A3A71_04200 [Candidatus Berkelbacteria bacterium RIFCSPLOWO2_01_FULL_50_28]
MITNDINKMTKDSQFQLMTTTEAAKLLRVSNLTIYRWIKAGKLPASKLGRNIRIKKTDLLGFVERNAL